MLQNKIKKAKKITIDKSIVSFVSTSEKERLQIEYFFEPEHKKVFASVIFGDLAQGPPGYAHGGAIAAVLDEAMGITAWMNNLKVLTIELTTQYHKAIKLNTRVYVESMISKRNGDELIIKSLLTDESGNLAFASAEAKFAILGNEKWLSIGIDTSNFISDDYIEK
jgi:acyl-coenzyme A thioesterase PaaI-like protein